MVSSGDIEYIETKKIKKGITKLDPSFTRLSDWIFDKYGVRPLNCYYDILTHNKRPRLQIIFEFYRDLKLFKADNGIFPNSTRQEEIKEIFSTMFDGQKEYLTDNLYVIFSAFEPIAKEEANGKIATRDLEDLKLRLNIPELWEIKRNFSTGIFFFYTNDQVKNYDSEKEKLKKEYFKLIKTCDEFGYLNESGFSIDFDSKENFDKIYQSNWFYYFKDH
jgi:hypothetical protein